MQMYVNYYDRVIKTTAENQTIGIVLCKHENNKTIFAKKYKNVLPSKTDLKKQLE
jgi:YhcG PDDEXK nuclease domain